MLLFPHMLLSWLRVHAYSEDEETSNMNTMSATRRLHVVVEPVVVADVVAVADTVVVADDDGVEVRVVVGQS